MSATPKPFLVRAPTARRPWSIKQGKRWRLAEDIVIQVTVMTTYRKANGGAEGEWFLEGIGVVRCLGRGKIVVTA